MVLKHKTRASQPCADQRTSADVVRASRIWREEEFKRMLAVCEDSNAHQEERKACIALAYHAGLRLDEIFQIDAMTAWAAVECNFITIKDSLGAVRQVLIQDTIAVLLRKLRDGTTGNTLLFAPNHTAIEAKKNDFMTFLAQHQQDASDPGSPSTLTFQGLRNTCAANWYSTFRKEGMRDETARCQVSAQMGWGGDWYVQ